jgi:hypothetical protein
MWRNLNGDSRSKLLLTKPEMVIAIVIRGETEQAEDFLAGLLKRRSASGLMLVGAAGWLESRGML